MRLRHGAMLIILAAIWGASFLFIRVAAPVLGPAVLVELRVLLAAAALWGYACITRQSATWRMRWKPFLTLGALNSAIPFVLIATAELHLTASMAAILNAMIPLFSVLVAAIARLEQLTLRRVVSLWVGFAGVVILVGWSPLPLTADVITAVGLSLLASLFYAVGGVYSKTLIKTGSSLDWAIGQQVAASLLILPVAVVQLPQQVPPPSVSLSVIALAVISTAIAYLIYFALIRDIGATSTLSVALLIPIFGTLWGSLFLNETLTLGTFVGMVLILISVLWITRVPDVAPFPDKQ